MAAKMYEILVSNEDTRDQVIRLLDEDYVHPNVTIMAFQIEDPFNENVRKPIDRYLHVIKDKQRSVTSTRIHLIEAPKSVEDATFFRQLGYTIYDEFGGTSIKWPLKFEIGTGQENTTMSHNRDKYFITLCTKIELNMPALTEIKIELFIR